MIGQVLGHYRIVEQLGSGGMGVVYRARDERLERSVALKLLSPEMGGRAELRARILAEARAASALNHPGITTIYEVGEVGEQLFIVMELVTGRTLRAMLQQGSIEVRALLRLGAQVAEALGAAHERGVVHGDVKPENVMVQADGRVKLLDFGIARQVAAETLTLSRTAATADSWQPDSKIAGTLAYLAPEVWRGGAADPRSDLFALGVVLYELAAGHRPFPGPTATALMAQILNEAPAPLSTIAPSAPSELVRIVHKLLEKQPDSRYQSAREVQVDLTNLARDLEMGAALPQAVAGKRAVAVLPFNLLTPSAEDEYLSVALLEEAKEGLRAALARHPDDANTLDSLSQTAFYQGNYEEAEQILARALSIDPTSFYANLDYPVVALYRGQLDRAAERIRTASHIAPGEPWLVSCEALLWARRGEPRKAEQTIRRALRGGKVFWHTHHMVHAAAAVYAVIGKPAQAVSLLRKASSIGLPNYPAFRDDPHFQPLHTYPPFLRLLADLKREWEGYRREFGGPRG